MAREIPDDFFEDDFDPYYEADDYDSGMSYSQQVAADRSDYASEMLAKGKIDPIQAAEIRMGA